MYSAILKSIIFAFLVLIAFNLQAQSKKSSDSTSFSLQIDYLSNYSYNGRSDSIKYPYQTTTASLHLANGIFSNFSASYLLTPGMKGFDFFELDLGYEYKIGKSIYGELYGSKYFYSGGANLINGNITSDLGVSFNYDFNYFQFNNIIDLFFTNQSDIQYTPGIEKTITLSSSSNKSWSINPYFYCNFSTVNYYESNVSRRLNGLKRPLGSGAIGPKLTSITIVDDKGFKLLNTDFSIPLTYENSHWMASFIPTYSIPFNKVQTTTTNTVSSITGTTTTKINSTPFSELNLNNQFYFQLVVTYKF